jgi:hypothetical protein
MAVKVDILEADHWYTNADYVLNCYVKQADGVTAQNVAGWTFSWVLKKRQTDPDASAILAKTSAAGITIIDAPTGHVRVAIADDDTDGSVKSGVYVHELKRTDPGFETPLIKGIAILQRSAHLS